MSWFTKDEKDKDQDLPQPQLNDKTISTVLGIDKKVTLHTTITISFTLTRPKIGFLRISTLYSWY